MEKYIVHGQLARLSTADANLFILNRPLGETKTYETGMPDNCGIR